MWYLSVKAVPTNLELRIYRHLSLSAVKWFQKNRALSETALTELHRNVSVQKLKSST
jgi:hypothetical protein